MSNKFLENAHGYRARTRFLPHGRLSRNKTTKMPIANLTTTHLRSISRKTHPTHSSPAAILRNQTPPPLLHRFLRNKQNILNDESRDMMSRLSSFKSSHIRIGSNDYTPNRHNLCPLDCRQPDPASRLNHHIVACI